MGNLELGPILRATMKNKTGAVLVILQVAFTMALVLNSAAIIQENARNAGRPSGVDEANVFHVRSSIFDPSVQFKPTMEEDLRRIRGLPGVEAAIPVNSVPMSGGGWSMSLKTVPDVQAEGVGTAVYFVDEHGVDALGANLIAGQMFAETDIQWREPGMTRWPDKTVVSEPLAAQLFPDDPLSAVGKTVYISDTQPMTIVGIVERLQAPWTGWTGVEQSMLVPQRLVGDSTAYLIRAEPGRRDALMPTVEAMLAERERGRIVEQLEAMDDTRRRSYELNNAMANILLFTLVLLIAITSLGISGLTNFNVTRRTKQIGTRRALGATRAAIIRYFLVENLLLTGTGVVLGVALSIGVNMLLVEMFSIPRISAWLIPAGMLVLLGLGMLAVLPPARRASTVPPAVATRTV